MVLLLAACAEPVFVPEAGPGAPGYTTKQAAPPPPDIKIVHGTRGKSMPAGGAIDNIVRGERTIEVTGWALIDADAPRGALQLVLPQGSAARVRKVQTAPRPDVVDATGNEAFLWAGFTVIVRGSLRPQDGICVLSRSKQGAFRLGGSDEGLCPP
jgi:hypothetical protein